MEIKNDLAKKRFLFGTAFVLLSVIVLLIVFLVNKDKIFTNLKETNFFEKIFGSTPAVIENHQVKHDENEELPIRENFVQGNMDDSSVLPGLKSSGTINNNSDILGNGNETLSFNNVNDPFDNNAGAFVGEFGVPGTFSDNTENNSLLENNNLDNNINDLDRVNPLGDGLNQNNLMVNNSVAQENIASNENISSNGNMISSNNTDSIGAYNRSTSVITKDVAPKAAISNSSLDLCFVMIDGDGTVLRKMVKRAVPRSDSPLTTAINLLLEGPDVRNKEEANCRSLIPEGSKLLSARVSNGVAYLNFNEDFEFNSFGVEGAIHQLEQIVYTATAFSTVNSVQFLIEGDKQEYLGSEGQWIGTPLSRANF